uniref:Uncharacterized protein n=1 Tax=viral metagenome TaxID=1070528 RepID=A0A6M3IQX5_9ZZZZ
MFICPFCDKEHNKIKHVKATRVEAHLIVTKDGENHIHVHGPVGNAPLMVEFIEAIAREAGIEIEA